MLVLASGVHSASHGQGHASIVSASAAHLEQTAAQTLDEDPEFEAMLTGDAPLKDANMIEIEEENSTESEHYVAEDDDLSAESEGEEDDYTGPIPSNSPEY